MTYKRELGDYQTPDAFAETICRFLKEKEQLTPQLILEPTCGRGSFLRAGLVFPAKEIVGIEINPEYCEECRRSVFDNRVRVLRANVFDCDFGTLFRKYESVLVIGNPPWVTSSTLSALGATRLPPKSNFKGLRGIDAVTGTADFDICETIILRLVESLKGKRATLAMLCKLSVARSVFAEIHRCGYPAARVSFFRFDAAQVFGISAEACLLLINLVPGCPAADVCTVHELHDPDTICDTFVFRGNHLCRIYPEEHIDYDGKCCFEWRQGIKHDCSGVMELRQRETTLENAFREEVCIESDYIFPLVKSSMFKKPVIDTFSKFVIVTQRHVREDTAHIARDAPRTWQYLYAHREFFRRRKSSIYRGAPDFSMFGVGDYSYSLYKVGISGFYKKPLFSVLTDKERRPVMIDDTGYFICLPSFEAAYTAMLVLNSPRVQRFLLAISFSDAKRPFTKKVLERLDFRKILSDIRPSDLKKAEAVLNLPSFFDQTMLEDFRRLTEVHRCDM